MLFRLLLRRVREEKLPKFLCKVNIILILNYDHVRPQEETTNQYYLCLSMRKNSKCNTRKQNIVVLKKNSTSRNSKINSKNARMIQ